MHPVKKTMVILNTARNYQRELEQLYARRSAIDDLIASLKDYDRYKATASTNASRQRKTA